MLCKTTLNDQNMSQFSNMLFFHLSSDIRGVIVSYIYFFFR